VTLLAVIQLSLVSSSGSLDNWIVISAVPMADVAGDGVCRRPSRPVRAVVGGCVDAAHGACHPSEKASDPGSIL
jgi:hypothetical protein